MKLFYQIIDKKVENYNLLMKSKQESLAYQEHISAYLLSLFYLGLEDKNIKKKESLWKSFVNTLKKSYFVKLLKFKPSEDEVIFRAMKKMDIVKQEQADNKNPLYSPYSWAILSYEHEVEE